MGKIKEFWKSLTIEEKLLALYILAFINTQAFVFMIGSKKVLYSEVIFLLLFVIFLWKTLRIRRSISSTCLKPIVVMAALFTVSFLNSVNLTDSFIELAGLIYLLVLFVIIINIITTYEKLRVFLSIWVGVACCVSLIGLFAFSAAMVNRNLIGNQFLLYNAIESMAHHFPRITSTFIGPNTLLTYLHVSLVFAIILLLFEDGLKKKLFILACIFVILLTAFFTGSRRFTGLLLSLFLILHFYGKGKFMRALKRVTFLGFLFFLIISIVTTIWVVFPVKVTKVEADKTISLRAQYSYSLHLLQVVTAMNMIENHPFIGVGFGTYLRHFKENVDWEWVKSSFGFEAYPGYDKAVEKKTLAFDPHSAILGTLAETGLIGLLGLLYFFLKYFKTLLGRFKRNEELSFERILSGCILAGFIGFLLNGLFTDILSMRYFWFMMALGLTCNKSCCATVKNRD